MKEQIEIRVVVTDKGKGVTTSKILDLAPLDRMPVAALGEELREVVSSLRRQCRDRMSQPPTLANPHGPVLVISEEEKDKMLQRVPRSE